MSLTGPRKRRRTFVSGRKEKEKRGKKKEIAGQVAGLRSTVRHRGERIVDGRTARATRNLARRHYSSRVPSSNGTESNCVGGLEKKNLTELVKRPAVLSRTDQCLLLCQLLRRLEAAPTPFPTRILLLGYPTRYLSKESPHRYRHPLN